MPDQDLKDLDSLAPYTLEDSLDPYTLEGSLAPYTLEECLVPATLGDKMEIIGDLEDGRK